MSKRKENPMIQLSYSCPEKWNQMKDHPQGKFCGQCQKKVVDVSTWSDKKLHQFISNEESCVRISKNQLNRPLIIQDPKPSWNWKVSAFLLGIYSFFSNSIYTQENPVKTEQNDKKSFDLDKYIKIDGHVFYDGDQKASNALVRCKGAMPVVCDSNGYFQFYIKKKKVKNDSLELEVSLGKSVHLAKETFQFNTENLSSLNIYLSTKVLLLSKGVVSELRIRNELLEEQGYIEIIDTINPKDSNTFKNIQIGAYSNESNALKKKKILDSKLPQACNILYKNDQYFLYIGPIKNEALKNKILETLLNMNQKYIVLDTDHYEQIDN